MKPILTYKIGSSYFFKNYEDYLQKDNDELCIMDSFPDFIKTNVLNMKKDGDDVFFYRDMGKDEFLKETLESGVPMKVGKFLIPEFSEHLGVTIEDLKILESLFDSLDDKHSYEKIIYNAYLENGGFWLTKEQLDNAYSDYKKKRPDRYE
jgi:hypothetical protein